MGKKVLIRRPKAGIAKIDGSERYLLYVEDCSILSVWWFQRWYGTGAMQNLEVECTSMNPTIMNKSYYIPKHKDQNVMVEYIRTMDKIITVLNGSKLKPDMFFGLLPLNIIVSFTVEVDKFIVELPAKQWDQRTFKERINSSRALMSDFGYVQMAIESAKKECDYGRKC